MFLACFHIFNLSRTSKTLSSWHMLHLKIVLFSEILMAVCTVVVFLPNCLAAYLAFVFRLRPLYKCLANTSEKVLFTTSTDPSHFHILPPPPSHRTRAKKDRPYLSYKSSSHLYGTRDTRHGANTWSLSGWMHFNMMKHRCEI